ncbi:uncharacterized protein [Epargyreus clarus]|uniref:uncharacterized protein n=1 Tax=Epargyreus clarus TaxID=520877 RepID=UPI003C309EDB
METGETALAQITVSSRVPSFWQDSPRLWFAQYEAVVANQKLSDESKYNLVVAKLTKDQVEQISDIVLSPPESKKYDTLKARLLAVYEESEVRQLQKLLKELDLGDQKPSQLLRRMRELARNKFTDETLSMLWMGHLPGAIRAVLTVSEVTDLEKLAMMADKVMETTRFGEVQEVTQEKQDSVNKGTSVDAEIAKINHRLSRLESSRTKKAFRREGQRRFSRSSSRSRAEGMSRKNPKWLCYYHYRYKEGAHKCIQPCAWGKQQDKHNEKN